MNVLRKLNRKLVRLKRQLRARRRVAGIVSSATYYPEYEKKSEQQVKQENLDWIREYADANDFYKLYGLDVKGTDPTPFLDNNEFIAERNRMCLLGKPNSQTVLLRDKLQFFKYLSGNGIPVPKVFAFSINGKLFDQNFGQIDWSMIQDRGDYFVKDIDGECASYVKKIRNYEDLCSQKETLKQGAYLFQEKLIQHPAMDQLNPNAINTLRIVSIYNDGDPFVLTGLLRVGTVKTGSVDNWAAGGLAVGISPDGQLKKYGFYKPVHGVKTTHHPDTGICFEDFRIPMYQEALKMVCDVHKMFYNIETIGWDVAITKDGPRIIEGNDNWEISLMQACDRPLKEEWRAIASRKNALV